MYLYYHLKGNYSPAFSYVATYFEKISLLKSKYRNPPKIDNFPRNKSKEKAKKVVEDQILWVRYCKLWQPCRWQ